MYEEPYRWVEAVGNRRQYLDEQFRQGSPVVAVSYDDGVLIATISRGTPKLYEIYDRIALAGMGHPADLEKLRFSLLEMAHLEGFNRSPSDVTGSRLMKYGLAPVIKQAFEEIYKAPFIVKILLAELHPRRAAAPRADSYFTINYDGTFEESSEAAVLAATPAIQAAMLGWLRAAARPATRADALALALRTWALGALKQQADQPDEGAAPAPPPTESAPGAVEVGQLDEHLRAVLADRTVECAVLERSTPGSSKYRSLKPDEWRSLVPEALRAPA